MSIAVRSAPPETIESFRDEYRREMDCQIVHESIHGRPGWTREYAFYIDAVVAGYGSLAVEGPWRETPTIYEFYVSPVHRTRSFELFEQLLGHCGAKRIETQSNDRWLTVMLHTYAKTIRTESILFEDGFETPSTPPGAEFRAARDQDREHLRASDLDEAAAWVVTSDGAIAGAGGVLYHYNPPYGDIYMKISEAFRRRGFGAYLVQQLKGVCQAGGKIPAARCNIENLASRRTLQRAGFVPCGNIIVGDLPT